MKTRDKMLFGLGLAILILLHWFLFPSNLSEGFFDGSDDYNRLRLRLRSELGSYCKISSFVRDQVNEMQEGIKKTAALLPSADAIKAKAESKEAKGTQSLMKAGKKREGWYNLESDIDSDNLYTQMYQCKDQLQDLRQSCRVPNLKMKFVPCSVYMNLPDFSDEQGVVVNLSKIKDDLPERLVREVEWFREVIKKIKDGLAAGANPAAGSNAVGVPPSDAQMKEYEKEAKDQEGFSGQCSAEANEYLRRKALEDEAKNCIPGKAVTAGSEVARVNMLLDDPSVRNSVSQCNSMMDEMLKLQSDLEKLKNGTLYDWQKGGPKKSYAKFEGGDRNKAFLFSLQQNQ